jgi:predicted permease
MRTLDRLRLRLRTLFFRERVDRELSAELEFHLEELTREKITHGLPPQEARAEALREFGGIPQLQEACRDARRTRFLEEIAADTRYALRLFAKSPGFTCVALVSLALGIGANTAIFTLAEALILRELPVRDPGALFQIVGVTPGKEGAQGSFSYPTFEWLRERGSVFSHVFTWSARRIEAGEGENMEWIAAELVSEDYFVGLGAAPALGRALGDEREQPAVAVVSHRWWQRRFDADPGAIGRSVRLGGIPFTVVGVMPEGFFGAVVGSPPDVFLPLGVINALSPGADRFRRRESVWLPLLVRLRPGTSEAEAAAAVEMFWRPMLEETGPRGRDGDVLAPFRAFRSRLLPASNGISGVRQRFVAPLRILAAVVALVWLIACLNLSNLMLARAAKRRRELALRLAVGAGRGRLLRQMLTESFLLASAGALLGALFALWTSRLLTAGLSTTRDAVSLDIRANGSVLAYTAGVTILTTLLFALLPALRALRFAVEPALTLKEGAQRIASGRTTSRALLVAQVALSLLLVAGATVFLRTLQNLLAVELGFDPERVLVATVDHARVGFKDDAAVRFYRDLQERLQALPGVEAASGASNTPIQGCCWSDPLSVEGQTLPPGAGDGGVASPRNTFLNSVAPGYFRVMGTRVLKGREFDERDATNAARVAIVNEEFARTYFPDTDPLGRTIALPAGYKSGSMQIVGVVENARYRDLRGPTRLAAYFPATQAPDRPSSFEVLVRTQGPPLALAPAVRQQIHAFHAALPVRFRSLAQEVSGALTNERLLAILSAFFGVVALVLGAVGLYGTVAYSVTQRTSEIGVRVALGASRTSILWLVMRQSVLLVGLGVAIGCAAAVSLTSFIATLVFGVQPTSLATLATAASVLATVALLSAWLPARRAASADPLRALRYE